MRKLMASIASLTLLLLGAVVALEALGLIFRAGPPQPKIASIQIGQDDPEAMAADLLWQRQEEAEGRRRSDQDRHQFEAARQAEAARTVEEEKGLADALAWAERYRRRREVERRVAGLGRPQAAAEPAESAGKPQPQHQLQDPHGLKIAAAAEPAPASRSAERSLAGPQRARSRRRHIRRVAHSRCPFLGWLHTVMAPSRQGAI
jgi:hypothetical protein